MPDVAPTCFDLLDFPGINIQPKHPTTGFGELKAKRQPDVSQADHPQHRRPVLDPPEQLSIEHAVRHGTPQARKKEWTASTTSSRCAPVSSGNTGSERTSPAARSDSGQAPGWYPR